jgi:hypothetical protein
MNNDLVSSAIGADRMAREGAHPHSVFNAFSDELTKIAFYQKLRNGFVNTLKEGWHGTNDNKATWFGKGRELRPGMGRGARMMEEAASLGGATRALPIGSKSMMLLGTGLMAREALKPVDPTGQQRSRTERMSGLAGNTAGGLIGSALGNRLRPGLLGSLGGGIIGGMAGEKLLSAPFAAARRHHMGAQPQQVPQQYAEGVPA